MGTSTTFGAIIQAATERADMVNSTFLSAAEWKANANASLQELQEKLIEAYGSDYFVQTPYSFTTDGSADAFDLPSDFFKLLGVDLQLSPSSAQPGVGWITIWRFNFAERNQFSLPNVFTVWGRGNIRYRLRGSKIWLQPTPQGGQTLRLWYVPVFTPLVDDADTYDGMNGWEEFAINLTAKKALVKEESDTSGVDALLGAQEARLTSITENRDAGAPQTTVDVYSLNGWPYGTGGMGGGWY